MPRNRPPGPPRPTLPPLFFAFALAALGTAGANAAVFRVGPAADVACDSTSILATLIVAALNGQDDEIRLSNGQAYNNVEIPLTDFPNKLTIIGGYPNCSAANPTGETTLNGKTTAPVISTDTVSGSNDIVLRNLVLNGPGTGIAMDGLRVNGDSFVDAYDLEVKNFGDSGISVDGADAVLRLDEASYLHDNSGLHGGGIRCESAAWVRSRATVEGNHAEVGGGIFAYPCDIDLYSGALVTSNDAINGGGIAAYAGSRVFVNSGQALVSISDNSATYRGGGIYAQDDGTTVSVQTGEVVGNYAYAEGGGIYAGSQAFVQMSHYPGPCADVQCSSLSNNMTSGVAGAAAYAGDGGTVWLYLTSVQHNSVNSSAGFGSILHANGVDSYLEISSVFLFGNTGADALLEGSYNGRIVSTFVSATLNEYPCDASSCPARPIILSGGATGSLFSSIYWPNSSVAAGVNGADLTGANCLLLSDPSNLPAGTVVITADPQFLDPAHGDLHLLPSSPAVDACDGSHYLATYVDIDVDPRPLDTPTNPNGFPGVVGTYDIGADEVATIFADGFESGDTSQWSSTMP